MSSEGWGATLLGAVAAMAWLAGPMPLPPQYHASGPAERECRPDGLLAAQMATCRAGGTVAG
jgi:hypothetical protein